MAIIPQKTVKKVILALQYINDQNAKANISFGQAEIADELLIDFTQAKIDDRKTRLKSEGANETKKSVQMFRWLLTDLGVAIPAAFTDAEVDAINSEIRQTDDGN